MKVIVQGQTFRLLPQKAVFWQEESCLILSDLHLGKGLHFIRGGVPLPRGGDASNLVRLRGMIEVLSPARLLVLGDLFHSHYNDHVEEVGLLLDRYPDMVKSLVPGNHDVLDAGVYRALGIRLEPERLDWGPFSFTHETCREPSPGYNISGHVHPGVRLSGKARQSLTLPCFYFGKEHALLPAFGAFTGLYRIRPQKGDRVYTVAEKRIFEVS